MKVRRSWTAAAALLVVSSVGGGLLLWHRADAPGPGQRPTALIPTGECQGTLDDARFSEALQSASTPTVRTDFTPPTQSAPAYPSCVVNGSDQRSLVATVVGTASEAERIHNEGQQVPRDYQPFSDGEAGDRSSVVRFSCVTRPAPDSPDHTWYYTAALNLHAPDNPAIPAPGRQKMAELSVALARQAVGKALGCTNTIQLPDGPFTFT
ncbi:hypothetical protein [Kitasatospora sp. NPDC058190]|uniref:hypothetical protein n=1 Tax=Kitasatospora sp. NPDC058190 TaxID=3346371 RepID=UPI0036DC04DE